MLACCDLWIIALVLTKKRTLDVRSVKRGDCSYEADLVLLERRQFVISCSQLTASLPLDIAVFRLRSAPSPHSNFFSSVPLVKCAPETEFETKQER